jgi:ABC-type dipeptide/oligopeptide/nickel transport system permease component
MRFIARRVAISLLTLVLVSLLTFLAFSVLPGDPARVLLGQDASAAQVAALREQMGLDRSFPERYLSWFSGFVTGDTGNSIKYQVPINEMVADYIPVTFSLAALALVFTVLIAVPLAVLAARREHSFLDRLISTTATVGMSVPGFFLGVIFIWLFGLTLHFFVAGRYVSYTSDIVGFIHYLVFPALAIAVPNAAILLKYLRDSIVQQMDSDYIRTAYSEGNTRTRALRIHAFKNAVIPALVMLSMIVGDIFAGSIIIEMVFSIPGIGRLLISSIGSRDFPMVQTLVVYIAFVVVIAQMLVDIIVHLVDPRIRVH